MICCSSMLLLTLHHRSLLGLKFIKAIDPTKHIEYMRSPAMARNSAATLASQLAWLVFMAEVMRKVQSHS